MDHRSLRVAILTASCLAGCVGEGTELSAAREEEQQQQTSSGGVWYSPDLYPVGTWAPLPGPFCRSDGSCTMDDQFYFKSLTLNPSGIFSRDTGASYLAWMGVGGRTGRYEFVEGTGTISMPGGDFPLRYIVFKTLVGTEIDRFAYVASPDNGLLALGSPDVSVQHGVRDWDDYGRR